MPLLTGIAMFALLTIGTIALQDAARFVVRYNLSTGMFFTLLGLAAPQFIVLSIPMGALLGTLISTGRLSADHEITALRAVGISLYRLLVPIALVGILLSGITFIGNDRVVPYCMDRLNDLENNVKSGKLGQASQQRVSLPIREKGTNDLRWLLVANETQGSVLTKVKLFYFDPHKEYRDFYITASRGIWQGDDWMFYDVKWVMLRPGDQPLVWQAEHAHVPGFSITPQSLGLRQKKAEDLTIIQLGNLIKELLKSEDKPTDKEILSYKTTLYLKYTIPLTPLFFMILAVPLAITPQRASSARGMGMALVLVLLYYVAMMVCQKLGATGAIPPLVAAWTPNAILLLAAVLLIHRREHS